MASVLEGQIVLENGETVGVAYLELVSNGVVPKGNLAFLHCVRSDVGKAYPEMLEHVEKAYMAKISTFTAAYKEWSKSRPFDAIIMVPSSRKDALPYVDAIMAETVDARNISDHFSKAGDWTAGGGKSLEDVKNMISVQRFDAADLHRVLIVDESLASSRTAAAILTHLRDLGLPAGAEVWCAVPLLMHPLAEP